MYLPEQKIPSLFLKPMISAILFMTTRSINVKTGAISYVYLTMVDAESKQIMPLATTVATIGSKIMSAEEKQKPEPHLVIIERQ